MQPKGGLNIARIINCNQHGLPSVSSTSLFQHTSDTSVEWSGSSSGPKFGSTFAVSATFPVADSTAAWHKMQDDLLNGLGIPMPGATSSEKNAAIIANVSKLVSPSLDYVYDAITETRMQLNGRGVKLGSHEPSAFFLKHTFI